MMWRDLNCDHCAKDCPIDEDGNYGEALCDIELAIAHAAIGNGKIDKAIADRAKLPFVDTIEQCPEFVEGSY
jgi:hypothetical protein